MRLSKLIACISLVVICPQVRGVRACTNFCLDTPDGPVFGSNLDLLVPGDGAVFINQRGIAKQGFQASTKGTTATWVSKYGSVTFNLAGREFAFGGMNEAGLVVGSMELLDSRFPEPDERAPLTIGTWAQYVLDTCGNVGEAVEVDKTVRIEDSAPPVHFLVADADGNCAAIEWLDGKYVCHKGEALPVKAMSNSIYGVALDLYKRKGGPSWWQSDRGATNKRFAQAASRCAGFAASGEPDALKYAFHTLTDVVVAPQTKWNIVYNIPQRQVLFRSVASPTLKYLSLRDFDLSCTAPLVMLDVNAAVEGDVSGSFKPFDYEVNLSLFRTLCERYELNVPKETAVGIMQLFNSFGCAQ